MSESEDELMRRVENDPDSTFREKEHSGESLCEGCPFQEECNKREESSDSWMLEDQYLHCHEVVGRREYLTDEQLLEAAILEGSIE